MSDPRHNADWQVEQFLATLLRVGVTLAAVLVLAGGIVYLVRHGAEKPDYGKFHGERSELNSLDGIVAAALIPSGRGLIQLGLLVLIATPVARVVFSVFAFARERDTTYVLMTLLVLGVLLYSLFFARF